MDDFSTGVFFISVVIALSLGGQAVLTLAENGGPKGLILTAWGFLIAVSAALLVGSIAWNALPASTAETYGLLGLISVVIFTSMTFEVLKKLKAAESKKIIADDL